MNNNLNLNLASDRPPVWWDDKLNAWGYRPSSIGACIRGLVAARCGYRPEDPSERNKQIMNEGHVHEPSIVEYALGVVKKIHPNHPREIQLSTQTQLILPVGEEDKFGCFLAGSMDGIVFVHRDDEVLIYGIEAKALGDSTFEETDKNGPSVLYGWQWSCYWHMLEEMIDKMRLEKKKETFHLNPRMAGMIFAFKRRSDGEKRHIFFSHPSVMRHEIETRVEMVEALARKRLEETAGNMDFVPWPECDNESFFCGYKRLHDSRMGRTAEEAPDLEPAARQVWEIGQKIKVLEEVRKELREEIDEELGGMVRARCGDFSLTRSDGSNNLDTKGLIRDFPHLREAYTRRGKGFLIVRRTNGGED